MNRFKYFILITIILEMRSTGYSQTQRFDIATYLAPKGWQEEKSAGHISYAQVNGTNWVQIVIYKSTASTGNKDSDFEKEWNELVAAGKTVSAPEKTAPRTVKGWNIVSGSGTWQYNGANVTSVLTLYSNDKVYFSVLYNSTAALFLKDYQALLESLMLNGRDADAGSGVHGNPQPADSSVNKTNNAVAGLWVIRQRESRGAGKYNTYTGGYMRKEYQFNKDGTYLFRIKNWLAASETIYFINESGTWSVNGDQLTLTPKKGKGGWWNKDKVTNDVDKWGSFKQAADYKLQSITYRFEIKEDPNYGNSIILYANNPTERDGGQFNEPPYRFSYTTPGDPHPWIDNPPGWKD